ncbi:cellulose biosynthesis protein BcsS [Candidatus Manganitrophus noduliformans]|uniref:Cellulose biosynthesis protein BcsS n=1 Tax=Candidatus Manganitrophus noduliformans TaxID=2606439 RepID=A0A7X6IBS7_9BACT|nr:hypothetical protein [Candidatus Manganitrophus noduliformans]NKE71724.1 hypothetical protein [Candidatus Manganitrophus noduliformans]
MENQQFNRQPHAALKLGFGMLAVFVLSLIIDPAAGRAMQLEGYGAWEGDSHGVGFGFYSVSLIGPLNERFAWIGKVEGSYLYYDFGSDDQQTDVTSPGAGLFAGGRLTAGATMAQLLAGVERRWDRKVERFAGGERRSDLDLQQGGVVQGMVDHSIGKRAVVNGFSSHSFKSRYSFGRLAVKLPVTRSGNWTDRLAVGLEAILQGNRDLLTRQGGGFIEIDVIPGRFSFGMKGGFKRTRFSEGEDQEGSYVGLQAYTRFR